MFGEKHGVGVGGGCIGLRPHFALHAFTASASPSISKELDSPSRVIVKTILFMILTRLAERQF